MEAAPELQIVIPIEGAPRLRLTAACFEDEQAIRAWLEANPRLARLIADALTIAAEMEAA